MIVSKFNGVDASSVDDEKIVCIIRDLVDSNGGLAGKKSLTLQAFIPARKAAQDIARTCGYRENTVSVHYEVQLGGDGDIALEEQEENVPLVSVCNSGQKRHNFTIHELEGKMPVKLDQTEGSNVAILPFSLDESVTLTWPTDTNTPTIMKPDIVYIGLVNQAMTCYLNSLLQTLFMTPEFRNALYKWSFDGSEEDAVKSIPYHLQRLFLQLQTSKKRAVETTDLTRSFGWDSSEVWHQHDVQELCRVMFDALEQKWKNTGQYNLINQLYQGKMKDYVKCLECGYESARVDAYLDIPLVIRPFGSNEAYGSVMEAMSAFVQPEILDGTNQYFCEKCNKKCNAHKGLKFVSFPYMLTLQLKRFDFDYTTMHRIKLNDKMEFPEILNLNPFVTSCDDISGKDSVSEVTVEIGAVLSNGQVDSSDEGIDEGIEVETGCSAASSSSDASSTSSDAAANNSRNSFHSAIEGRYVYELFSIMIHSGSAAGGHYYAYIKSFKDGQWYSFNDQQVSKITYDDIRKTYGSSSFGRGFYSSTYSSSTSAYMLMYRQIDKALNSDFMQPEEFPEFLKAELKNQKDKEEAERRQREIDKSTCKIKLYCFHPIDQRKMDLRFEIHKDKTLTEATENARELFNLEPHVPKDCCRLVKYDEYQDSLERSFEGEEETTIANLLGGIKANYTFDLLLETKRPEQVFMEYKPGGVTVKVHQVDIYTGEIHPPVSVRAYLVQTVAEFKQLLVQVLGVTTPSSMRLVLERFHNDLRLLVDPLRTLKADGFYKSNKVFLECSGDVDDNSVPYTQSRLHNLLDQYQHTIRITCCLPSQTSVQEYSVPLKETQLQNANGADSPQTYFSSHVSSTISCHESLYNQGQTDEGISENDSAFYSGDTISKHSTSGLDRGSSDLSINSLSTTDTRQHLLHTSTYNCGTLVDRTGQNDKRNTKVSNSFHGPVGNVHSEANVGNITSAGLSEANDDSDASHFLFSKTEIEGSLNFTPGRSDGRKVSSSIQHSSSHEHLITDASCPKPTLPSCYSDPSIYHSCLDYSDSSIQCLGSGPSSGSQEDTSTSAEFNFSCSGPDPEPILSSPEEGYGYENGDEDLGMGNNLGSIPMCEIMESLSDGLGLSDSARDSAARHKFNTSRAFSPEDDWDREAAETSKAEQGDGAVPTLFASETEFKATEMVDMGNKALPNKSAPSGPPPPPPLPPPPPPPPPPPQSGKSYRQMSHSNSDQEEEELEVKRYFSAVMNASINTNERILNVSVDKRITLGAFKQELEPYVGVPSNHFKVYRVYSNNQEFESVRLSDTLSFFEDGKFNIKLGRALQPGEHRVKVFQLCVNEPEPCKFLIETIFAKGMSVLKSKHLILKEIKEQCSMDIPLDRCRLRKKSCTNPGTVYVDNNTYENDIPIYPNWEIFLEVLNGPEELLEALQLAIYVRRWHPSTYQIGPFQEVILKPQSVEELKKKISALSEIPLENVEFAKGKGTFPCQVSVLEINSDLEWNPDVMMLNMWPLYICDDGHVMYYRDNKEMVMELSDKKRKEIQQKENRTTRPTPRISCFPRKERALKIYTDEDDDPSPRLE